MRKKGGRAGRGNGSEDSRKVRTQQNEKRIRKGRVGLGGSTTQCRKGTMVRGAECNQVTTRSVRWCRAG